MAERTIYALASATGRAGVAVIRISGEDAFEIASGLMRSVPDDRGVRRILNEDGELIDSALVLRFDRGHSFTGEDTIEVQCHGSTAVVAAIGARLEQLGARPAGPGDFTRRALENGSLDLAQVEGLADLIDAETEAQRKQAVRVFGGALGDMAERWRSDLIRANALIEATIDFVDEDVPVDVLPEVLGLLHGVRQDLAGQAEGAQAAERVRTGFEVAIVGPPNIGKSTLLNRLAGREAAITSEIAGTTRDIIEVRMNLNGLAVTFLDTAGVRETDDTIEQLGVALAITRARQADLRVFLIEEGGTPPLPPEAGDIVLLGKADSSGGISGKTGAGVQTLLHSISEDLSKRAAGAGVAIRDRHRIAMIDAGNALNFAVKRIKTSGEADLIAEDLRLAIRCLDSLVGRVDVEDLLSEIFMSFCIGK